LVHLEIPKHVLGGFDVSFPWQCQERWQQRYKQ
jgi:hypothetical protein